MSVADRVAAALACAALDRDLRAVVLVDLDPVLLPPLGRWLAALRQPRRPAEPMLVAAGGRDRLWTELVPSRDPRRPGPRLVPGALIEPAHRADRVFLVPDLARAGRPVLHAMVMTLGAEEAHLERDGLTRRWRPEARWLACCRRDDLERVSAHLLDRFALRVNAAGLHRTAGPATAQVLPPPSAIVRAAVRRGVPALATGALLRAVAARPADGRAGHRADLALVRTAAALAALAGRPAAGPALFGRAAELVGVGGTGGTEGGGVWATGPAPAPAPAAGA
ncbi:hypothetical protein, partial [Paractinoplanes rishiriensis]|uniref:hypothetical protein n=1 Tax=Paractinoplanes rishiriensis TaxID=1050105 RepID=UPI0019458660